MSQPISLREAERKAFRTATDDGLWDVFLGCFVLMFALAPLLSETLGDFWSSMIFLPFWGLVYLAIRLLRKHVVTPRIGRVTFGRARRARLALFTRMMLVLNLLALIAGIFVAANYASVPGQAIPIILGLVLLIGFGVAGWFLDYARLYLYGLLLGLAPLIGEWLFVNGYAAHHGFPVTFGLTAALMIFIGLAVFVRLVRANPVPSPNTPAEQV